MALGFLKVGAKASDNEISQRENLTMELSKKIKTTAVSDVIRHIFLAWLIAAAIEYLCLPKELQGMDHLKGLAEMSFPRLLAVTAAGAVFLWATELFVPICRYERWGIFAMFALLAALALTGSFSWPFLVLCLLVLAAMAVYAIWGHDSSQPVPEASKKAHWGYAAAVAVLALAFFAAVCAWTVGRYRTFSTPNYDFGIFSQMFYSMKQTGLPMTTVERDGLLSHFAVHVSPIYYLMLPFYCLFPTPVTLQVLQAAVLASAVIPLWLIGKQHKLSGLARTLLCALLLLLPVTSGGTSYDLHENCFLLPLILWLLYAMDRGNAWLTAIFALLTLMVKEDAAVYVAVAGLYLTVRSAIGWKQGSLKDLLTGLAVLTGAIVWFLLVTSYLANHGDGVMTNRYDNFMYDGSDSLITVVKAVFLSPMKMLFECIDLNRKVLYIAKTLIPMLGLPLLTRKFHRYLLLIPYILVNLMTDYQYQHNLFFQYNFGSTAFLIYLTAVNLSDIKPELPRLITAITAAAVSLVFFCYFNVPKIEYYTTLYSKHEAYYTGIREALDTIPEGASVTCHTFYGAYLSDREVLYDVRYASQEHLLSTEFVVLKESYKTEYKKYATGGEDNGYENLIALLEENGYVPYHNYQSTVVIYQKAVS